MFNSRQKRYELSEQPNILDLCIVIVLVLVLREGEDALIRPLDFSI